LKYQSCKWHRVTRTTTVNNSSVQLGKYPFLNVRLALLSRTLSPGENLHDFVGPFFPYSLLDTVVWLAHVTSAGNEETKASIVERLNRTLKTKMWKDFTHRETLTYVEVLSEMVASYNHTVHRTIGTQFCQIH
jgi:hypothetical protein